MLVSEETRDKLNELLGEFFYMNSCADNFAYNIDVSGYELISEVYHKSFAHAFTGDDFADGISNFMISLDARPIRNDVGKNDYDYNGNLVAIFADNVEMCKNCRKKILELIELAELNEDCEVKIWGEELLMKFVPYYKQARVWEEFSKKYENDYMSLNVYFKELTKHIAIV